MIALPVLVSWLMRPVIARLAGSETRWWARNTASIALLVPVWLVISERDLLFATIPTAITVGTCVVLRMRPARFTRWD